MHGIEFDQRRGDVPRDEPPVEFSDGSIGIRRFRSADVPLLFAAARESAVELCTWMTWCHLEYSLADAANFVLNCDTEWSRGTHYSFAIFDSRSGAFLGSVGLSHLNRAHRFANVGYWVRTSRTGQGIASTALRLIGRFALTELDLIRVEIVAALDNRASQRVAEKSGARREGILRSRLLLRGEAHDAVLFSLVPEDLEL
jgi:ribosomal-protein-serine acetyltransferase